jgi:hypothetical protein
MQLATHAAGLVIICWMHCTPCCRAAKVLNPALCALLPCHAHCCRQSATAGSHTCRHRAARRACVCSHCIDAACAIVAQATYRTRCVRSSHVHNPTKTLDRDSVHTTASTACREHGDAAEGAIGRIWACGLLLGAEQSMGGERSHKLMFCGVGVGVGVHKQCDCLQHPSCMGVCASLMRQAVLLLSCRSWQSKCFTPKLNELVQWLCTRFLAKFLVVQRDIHTA